MKIINKSIFHDNEIKKMVEFAMPEFVKHFFEETKKGEYKFSLTVTVETGDGATGSNSKGSKGDFHIYLRVPASYAKYPYQEENPLLAAQRNTKWANWLLTGRTTADYIPTLVLDRAEHFVHCAAHELRHILQYLCRSCIMSDLDADMYAIHKQRQWRHLHNKGIL
jgi:hypothetical protein